MVRKALFAATAVAALAQTTIAAAEEATTTRVETRAFYGATVTLEAGVRVFRPLPPHSKVIINPGGTTPLNLGIDESRSYHNHTYNTPPEPRGQGAAYDAGGGYYPGGYYAGGAKYGPPFYGHRPRYGLGVPHRAETGGPRPPLVRVPVGGKPVHHGPGPGKH